MNAGLADIGLQHTGSKDGVTGITEGVVRCPSGW